MVDLFRQNIAVNHEMSASELVNEFIDCYGTYDKKSDYTSLDVEDIPFDQRERYAKICINDGNHDAEFIVNSDSLMEAISCIVGNELDYDKKEDLVDSIRHQAVGYYEDQLIEEIEKNLRERIPDDDTFRANKADFVIELVKSGITVFKGVQS